MPKPLPVSFSIIKAKAEEMAKSLGETNFKASSGWWEKVRKRNGIGKSVRLHGEAREVDHEQIKSKIDEIRKDLESYDPESIYNWDETVLYFKLIPLIQHEMKKEDKFEEQRHRKRKIELHSLIALMPQELTRFLWQ